MRSLYFVAVIALGITSCQEETKFSNDSSTGSLSTFNDNITDGAANGTSGDNVADGVGEEGRSQFDNVSEGIITRPEPGTPIEKCVDQDRIYLNFPPEIQSCIDQNRIFDFNTGNCLSVVAASFACGFDAMADKVGSLGINNSSIYAARDGGAKIIACGEKSNGKTVISQWYYPGTQNTCDFDVGARITTACYKVYAAGQVPPNDTPEQRAAAVRACLNE